MNNRMPVNLIIQIKWKKNPRNTQSTKTNSKRNNLNRPITSQGIGPVIKNNSAEPDGFTKFQQTFKKLTTILFNLPKNKEEGLLTS